MGEAAAQIDYVALFHETSYAGWDADMIRSCVLPTRRLVLSLSLSNTYIERARLSLACLAR